jgi:hypothetical protein
VNVTGFYTSAASIGRLTMLTILHPESALFVHEIAIGLWPLSLPGDATPRLVIKTTKEMLLAAKVNGGFKIYAVPLIFSGKKTIGLMSAFFDVKDEPLVIYTPLFADDDTHKLIDMLMLPTLDVHFFDEHSREWLGYTSSLTCPPVAKDRMKEGRLLPFDLSLAKLAHTQLHQWFGTRTQIDDQDAISIDFRESHFADDLVILDARADNHLHQGGHSFSFSQLEREEPGAFQEQDIAHLLGRLFDPRDIYMNPLRVTDREEIADLLVLTESEMIVVQAKDSPNTERTLRNTIARKKATARKALMKAINQVRGALRYMHSTSPFEMILGNIVVPVQIGRRQVRALIVVKELFNDEFGAYSPPILQLSKETGIPCIALDYPELQGYTGMSSREKFFEAFDLVYNHAQKSGELPRMRIWMAGDGGTE